MLYYNQKMKQGKRMAVPRKPKVRGGEKRSIG